MVCKGLSLNDCYWVVDEDFRGTFDSVNLYDNHFSRTLAHIAFTGFGNSIRSTFRSSPEFTTNGMLAKHYMADSQRRKLRRLQNFKFKKHPRYNWSNKHLKTVENVIQERVAILLS